MTEQMQEYQGDIWDVANPIAMMPKTTIDLQHMYYENAGGDVSAQTNYRVYTTDESSYYYLPSAHLQVDFSLTQAGGAALTEAQQTAIASNGWCLFEDVRLKFQDNEVMHVQKPGKVSHMVNLIEKGKNYIETVGENAHYFLDSVSDNADLIGTVRVAYTAPVVGASTTVGTTPVSMVDEVQYVRTVVGGGCTNAAVTSATKNPYYDPAMRRKIDRVLEAGTGDQKLFLPCADILPILMTDRVVRGSRIELELNKISNAAEALFGLTTDAKLTIKRVRLWMARVKPSLQALARVESQIASNPVVTHNYDNLKLYRLPYNVTAQGEQVWQLQHKANKPTKVFVAFQYALRDTDARLNPLQFDLLGTAGANNLSKVELRVNGRQVPSVVYDPSYDNTRILHELYRLGSKDIEDSACLNKKNWKSMFPIFGFDLSAIEGSSYESRSHAVLDLIWTTAATVANTGLATSTYNVVALVVSEGSAIFDYSSGQTTIRTA